MSYNANRFPTMHLRTAGMAAYMGIKDAINTEKARAAVEDAEYDELQAACVQMRMSARFVTLKVAFKYRDGRVRYNVL